MNRTHIFVLSLFLFYASNIGANEKSDCQSMGWESFDKECVYGTGGVKFHIFPSGKLNIVQSSGEVIKQRVMLPEKFFIESVSHEPVGEDILFIFGITDADAGSSVLALFNKQELKIKWQTVIGAFNISSPLVGVDAIYVGAIGTIAKIDINTGVILWRHRHLYERDTQAFNSFIRPVREGHLIKFREQKVSTAKYDGVREIVVDDMLGKILSK